MKIPFSPYQLINILTGSVIVAIVIYSATFSAGSNSYRIECVHVAFNGGECSTCGLTQSFVEMTRGNFATAFELNRNGPLLFTFFISQLFLRMMSGFILVSFERISIHKESREKKIMGLVITDSILSGLLFIVCFRFLLVFW